MTRYAALVALLSCSCATTERGRGTQLAAVGGGAAVAGSLGLVGVGAATALLMADGVDGTAETLTPQLVAGAVVGAGILGVGVGLLWYGGALIDDAEGPRSAPPPPETTKPPAAPAPSGGNTDATPW